MKALYSLFGVSAKIGDLPSIGPNSGFGMPLSVRSLEAGKTRSEKSACKYGRIASVQCTTSRSQESDHFPERTPVCPEDSNMIGVHDHFYQKKPFSRDRCRRIRMMAEWLKPVQRSGDDLFVRSPAEDSGMRRDVFSIGSARSCY